jgi:hypothetical protein
MPEPAQINRSLSTVRTELEFLRDSGVLLPQQLESIMAQLPQNGQASVSFQKHWTSTRSHKCLTAIRRSPLRRSTMGSEPASIRANRTGCTGPSESRSSTEQTRKCTFHVNGINCLIFCSMRIGQRVWHLNLVMRCCSVLELRLVEI